MTTARDIVLSLPVGSEFTEDSFRNNPIGYKIVRPGVVRSESGKEYDLNTGTAWFCTTRSHEITVTYRPIEIAVGTRVRVLEGSRAFVGKPGTVFTVTRVVRHVNPHENAPRGFDWYAEGKTDVGEHAAAWGHFLEVVPTPEPPSNIIYGDEIEAVRQAIDSFEWEVDRFFENPSDARNLERAAWGIFSAVHDLTREMAGVEE